MKRALFSGIIALAILSVHSFSPAHAQDYTIALQTDQQSYSGIQPIVITGTVSPPPGPNTAVVVEITNSEGALADIDEVAADPATGSFNYTSHPGGSSAWTSGTFTVNATWGGDSSTATQVVTFQYTAGTESPPSTSSSSSSSSSSSTSASSSSSSTTISSSTSSSTSTSTSTSISTTVTAVSSSTTAAETASSSASTTTSAPEFPAETLTGLALFAAALVALASRRLARWPSESP